MVLPYGLGNMVFAEQILCHVGYLCDFSL